MSNRYSELFKNKRLLSVDYGLKRAGLAVCDEFHITTSPLAVLDLTKDDIILKITQYSEQYNIAAVIVGMPVRLDNEKSELILKIEEFIDNLQQVISLPVIAFDESFSTVRATETLIQIGRKKKKRSAKGEKDKIAAAIILRDFLNELN